MILKITSHLDILGILVASMAVNILRGKYLSLKARKKERTRNEAGFEYQLLFQLQKDQFQRNKFDGGQNRVLLFMAS